MKNTMGNGNEDSNQNESGEAPVFWFKLRIELSPLQVFWTDLPEIGFRLEEIARDVTMKAVPRGPLKETRTIDFDVHGFHSREEAHSAGLRLRKAVMLAGAIEGIGIDTGIDQTVTDGQKQKQMAQGYAVKNRMQGLTVHDGELTGAMFSDACIVAAPDPREFQTAILRVFSADPSVTDKQSLALQLYGLSQFETSLRARILVLISAVEVLSECGTRPQESRVLLDQLITVVRSSSIDADQRESLISGLAELRRDGISKSCRNLIENYLGSQTADEFKQIYRIRSKLVHSGDCGDGSDDIESAAYRLSDMISEILQKMTQSPGESGKRVE